MSNTLDLDGYPICPACGCSIDHLCMDLDLDRRPVRVESDYLIHFRCWNPVAVRLLSAEVTEGLATPSPR